MSDNVSRVVGARGVIGGNLVRHSQGLDGWRVIGLSRRDGESARAIRHVSVDLLDATDARRMLADLRLGPGHHLSAVPVRRSLRAARAPAPRAR